MSDFFLQTADIETGDVIFSSVVSLVSTGIQLGTNSIWSHVGIAVRLDDSKKDESAVGEITWREGQVYILDCSNRPGTDPYTGQKSRMCRFMRLERIINISSHVGYRKVNLDRNQTALSKFKQFVLDVINMEWRVSVLRSMAPAFSLNMSSSGSDIDRFTSNIHCAELVGHYIRRLVNPDIKIVPCFLSPADFSTNPVLDPAFRQPEALIYRKYYPMWRILLYPVIIFGIMLGIAILIIYVITRTIRIR